MASEKITNMIEEIKTLTVLELNELVKALEEEFGVYAAPKAVKENVPYADAEAMKATLEAAGAVVELK